ncbi:MAG: hypothetical protein P1U41_07675 [Vicingaceae bacterium]|nr:hypothetical protein [Vicingaceae bacterium]
MKRLILTLGCFLAFNLTTHVFAQDANTKSIILNEDNGIKTLTIVLNENNATKTEIYKNGDADAKLAELEKTGKLIKTIIVAPDGTAHTKIEVSSK